VIEHISLYHPTQPHPSISQWEGEMKKRKGNGRMKREKNGRGKWKNEKRKKNGRGND
jgi:hypothetical protein